MKKRTLGLLLAIFLILSGCAQKEDFAVKVNDIVVPMKLYEDKLSAVKDYFVQQGMDLDAQENSANLGTVKTEVLESIISSEIISQEVEKNKWDLQDPEITKQIEDLKTQIPDGDYEKWLKEQAMTNEEVIEYFAFTNNISKDVTVSDEEVQSFFDANFAQYGGQQEQVKARHILLDTEEEAQAVIDELNADGGFTEERFTELAKEKSTDETVSSNGGDLGYFSKGDMVAEFAEAAFAQKVGTLSEKPVKSEFGFHVIWVEDHKQEVKPDFTSVKDQVKEDALANAKNQKVVSYYSQLRESAKIEYAEELDPNKA